MRRVGDAAPHVDLRGVVQDDVKAALPHERRRRRRADVQLGEFGPRRHVGPPAGGEVVEHDDVESAREQGVGDVRADEARAAGEQGAW